MRRHVPGIMISAGVGFSTDFDLEQAVKKALSQASEKLASTPTVVFAYIGVTHDPSEVLRVIQKAYPGVPVVGGTSQGVSLNSDAHESTRFVAIALLSDVSVEVASVDDYSTAPFESGMNLATKLGETSKGNEAVFLFYDPLHGGNAQYLVHGLNEGGINHVLGGATGQPWGKIAKTHQFGGDRVLTKGAVALRLRGVSIVSAQTHGAEPIGLEVSVTKSEGNVVMELDGRPALDVWCEQLGVSGEQHVENSANWALGVKYETEESHDHLIALAPYDLDKDNRSLIFQAPVPEGRRVQVCIRTMDAVFDGAVQMGKELKAKLRGKDPIIAFGFECGARPTPFLGEARAKEEVCRIQESIGDIPWLGFYAWGEIAPVGNKTLFHNFTFPLSVVCKDS